VGGTAPIEPPAESGRHRGGPAGLECARVARLRGHAVVALREERGTRGPDPHSPTGSGTAGFSTEPAGSSRSNAGSLAWKLRLGAEADVARVLGEAPEVAVVATGARAFRPNLLGLEDYGFSAWESAPGN